MNQERIGEAFKGEEKEKKRQRREDWETVCREKWRETRDGREKQDEAQLNKGGKG